MLTKRILKYVEENGEGEMISKKKLWNLLKLHEIAVREDEQKKVSPNVKTMTYPHEYRYLD